MTLHIDFWVKQNNPQHPKFKLQIAEFIDILLPVDKTKIGDVLVIAGDIGHYNQQAMFVFIELKKFYKNIIVTWGNHDMYMVSNAIVSKYGAKSINRLKELKEICESLDIHFLDGEVINIDGVKFGGTGSWYNLPTAQDLVTWQKVMNDSNLIYDGYKVNSYGMYQSYSQPSNNWDPQVFYELELVKLKDIAEKGCDVFITHIALHEPTQLQGMTQKYLGDAHNIFYYTENIDLVKKSGAKLHLHGHTHQSLDYLEGEINVICNPLGYPSDNNFTKVKQIII